MKKANFLIKLYKEGKLQLVNPSDEIKDSYLEKSESSLISSKILLKNDRLEESIVLAYYSMYHILTALLFNVGLKCENHTGAIILLKDIFNINNSVISSAKRERLDKQYYTDFHVMKQEVVEAIKETENFNKEVFDFISKLGAKERESYKQKFKDLISGR